MRAAAGLLCIVACAVLATPAAAAPARVAVLLPVKGESTTAALRFSRGSVSGTVQHVEKGKRYRLGLSSRNCPPFEEGDPDQPIALGVVSGFIHAEKNQDIEVENDETHTVGHDRAVRSAVVVGPGRRVLACGAAQKGRSSATAAIAGDGVSVVAARRGRQLRAAITCEKEATCRLMEDEGIFYFARQQCGEDRGSAAYAVPIGDGARQRADGVMVGFWILDPIALKARSFRLDLEGVEVGCSGRTARTTAAGAKGPRLAYAKFDPFAGQSETGLIIIEALPARTRITGSFSWGESNSYTFHLSRRTCGALRSNPGKPGFIGKAIYSANPANGVFEGNASRKVARRQLRATKSIVLVGGGEGRACGTAYLPELEEVSF